MSDETLPRILLVEDDVDLRENIAEFLAISGYDVTGIGSAAEFYRALGQFSYKIAIIDIGLPDGSGFMLAKYLRGLDNGAGIIILTANDAEAAQIKGYRAGADNYLIKPVTGPVLELVLKSLLARLDHLKPGLRPSGSDASMSYWCLSKTRWVLTSPCDVEIHLTALEFKFLTQLAKAKGKTIDRHNFLELLYPSCDAYTGRSLDAMVRRLRKKITDSISGSEQPIKTVYGSGYCFPELTYI